MGLFSMIMLCINGTVGMGLFLLPGQVAAFVGNWSLAIFGAVSLVVLAIAWCFTKCASHFTRNGGAYLYAKEAFGEFIGFEIGMMRWAVGMIAWASLTVGLVTALGSFFPVVLMTPYRELLIGGFIALLGIINLLGVNTIKHFSNVFTLAKLLPLFAFLLFGFSALHVGHFALGTLPAVGTWGSAALLVFYAFGGFDSLPLATTDLKDPKKNVPRAMMAAVILAAILYIAVQAICMGVLGPSLIGEANPIAAAAAVLFGSVGKYIVSCCMLVAIGGVCIVSSFTTPKSCSAMAEEGSLFPKLFEKNRLGAPYLSIIISTLLTIVIALSGNFVELVAISALSRFAQYLTTCLSLYVFDKRGVMQPFDKPWKKAIPLVAIAGIGAMLASASFYQLLLGFGALIIGVPLYYLQKRFVTKAVQEIE